MSKGMYKIVPPPYSFFNFIFKVLQKFAEVEFQILPQ